MDKKFKEWWLFASRTLKCDQYDAYEIWQQAQKTAVPDGWVVVPKEPTVAMLENGNKQYNAYHAYKAMIESQEKENGS